MNDRGWFERSIKVPRSAQATLIVFFSAGALAALAMVPSVLAQPRSMESEYSRDELAGADRNLRRLQQEEPLIFEQILNDINQNGKARDPASAEALAAASPALEDLNRSSPEALLGLFLLLKGAAKPDGKSSR
jgi:predicted PurR-regulated permease PerM